MTVLVSSLLVHMPSIEQDLILAVQDLHRRIVYAKPEEVVLKVANLHAMATFNKMQWLLCPSHREQMDILWKPTAIIWNMARQVAMYATCGCCLQCRKDLSLGLPRTHIVSEQGIMEAQRFLKGFPFYSTLAMLTTHAAGRLSAEKGDSEQKIFSLN